MKLLDTYGQVLNKRLNDAYRPLSKDFILKLASRDVAVNNVVLGLNRESFGLWSYDDGFSSRYTLSYINSDVDVCGDAIDLNLEDNDVFDLTMAFCNHLTREYVHLDLVTLFNDYCQKLRSYVEAFGYRTVTTQELGQLSGNNFTLMAKAKDIVVIPFIDRVAFYRDFFDNSYSKPKPLDVNVVYLLLNLDNMHIKIGRSKKIMHREKTLQAQEPNIETIAFWKAPQEAETKLHQMFHSKRIRGEWFNLTFADMKLINQFMKCYLQDK